MKFEKYKTYSKDDVFKHANKQHCFYCEHRKHTFFIAISCDNPRYQIILFLESDSEDMVVPLEIISYITPHDYGNEKTGDALERIMAEMTVKYLMDDEFKNNAVSRHGSLEQASMGFNDYFISAAEIIRRKQKNKA